MVLLMCSIPILSGGTDGTLTGVMNGLGQRYVQYADRSAWPNALELYFNTPATQQSTGLGYLHRTTYSYAVKAQFRLIDAQKKTWYFPAPSPKTLMLTSEAHNRPDFSNNEQPFWASE